MVCKNLRKIKEGISVCHICSSIKTKQYCEKNGYVLYKCQNCNFIFVHPTPSDLSDVYSEHYFHDTGDQAFGYSDYDSDKEPMRHIFDRYLSTFEKLSDNRNILDVGCATGYFLDLAKERGWKTTGVEISEYAAEKARKRGHIVYTGQLPHIAGIEKAGVVTLWDVLEHVDNPRAYLESVYCLLDDTGYLAINTVDTSSVWARLMGKKWHLIVPPEHIHYYTPDNLKLLLRQTGFEILEIHKIGKKFSLPYFFMMGYRWQGFELWKLLAEFFDRPIWRRVSLPVNLRDNMFLLAKKAAYDTE